AVPAHGNRKADAVTRAAVAHLHSKLEDKPYQANRLLAVIGSLFTFAERRGAAIREGETVGIPGRDDGDKPRSKHLPKEESQRTLISADAAAALRLLIFTGARLREILDPRWE